MARSAIEEVSLEAEPPRPSVLLKLAEDQACDTARFLREHERVLRRCGGKASVEDALHLADLVVALATRGQKSSAAQATEILSAVEIYLDQLADRVDDLFASTK